MYRDFYKLSDEPFRVTPDPDFLFLANQYKEALAAIVYGIAKRKGFVCITGEVGVGKTTILRSYLSSVEDQDLTFVYIFNPKVSFPVLMRTILRDLGQSTQGDVAELVERLHEHLIECYRRNRTVVLFVDEAQNMPVETLEAMRLLSNLETTTDKLIQIVLVGQPELDQLLANPRLRPLKSRIVVRAKLLPMGKTDSLAYIRHRLSRVALDSDPVFTDGAMETVVQEAGGVPRLINILCDAALITGFGYRVRPIPRKVVREVVADTLDRPKPPRLLPWAAALLLTVGGAAAGLGAWQVWGPDHGLSADPIGQLIDATDKMSQAIQAAKPQEAPRLAAPMPPPKMAAKPAESAYGPAGEGPDPAADLVRVPTTPPAPEKAPEKPEIAAQPAPPPPPAEAPAPAQPPVATRPGRPSPAAPVDQHSVVVQKGDTLSKVSMQLFGTVSSATLDALRRHNPSITDPNKVFIGQVIAVPKADGQEAALRSPQ